MIRLPTHLESLVPPPRDQVPQTRPWRGVFFLPAASGSPHERGTGAPVYHELHVTAAETEGDNQIELWPPHFYVHVLNQRGILQQVQGWVRQNHPPLCMFMPSRMPDDNSGTLNQARFEALSRALLDGQMVAIAPWNLPDRVSGAGIILFPTTSSKALLAGAIFVTTNFPDFVQSAAASPTRVQPLSPFLRQMQFQPPPPSGSPYETSLPNIASSSRHAQGGGAAGRF